MACICRFFVSGVHSRQVSKQTTRNGRAYCRGNIRAKLFLVKIIRDAYGSRVRNGRGGVTANPGYIYQSYPACVRITGGIIFVKIMGCDNQLEML